MGNGFAKIPSSGIRLVSIDAFRGFDIILMTFVNYLAGMKFVPACLQHAAANADTLTIADLVFPGFLFIVGTSIPFALRKRLDAGESYIKLFRHILERSAALIFLGVLLLNKDYFSPEAAGINKNVWYLLAYIGIFMAWNIYPKSENPKVKYLCLSLKISGFLLLGILVATYRGTLNGEIVWLQTGWWGILGIIGWAYLACAALYIVCRGCPMLLLGTMGVMLAVYIGGKHGSLDFMGAFKNFICFGSNFGTKSAVVMAGVIVGICISPVTNSLWATLKDKIKFIMIFGFLMLIAGFLLRPLHTISKIWGTDSYSLISAGICCLGFMLFFLVIDHWKFQRLAKLMLPSGQNPLLIYLLPGFLNCVMGLTGTWKWFFPMYNTGGFPGILNALVMTFVVLGITALLGRWKVILKL